MRHQRTYIWISLLLLFFAFDALGEEIKNPYHKRPAWKLWFLDPTPVKLDNDKILALPPLNKRIYPDDADTKKYPGSFLAYRNKDWPERKYAGIWDDVYSNRDKGHSYINPQWSGENGNSVKIIDSIIHLKGEHLYKAGANFTSQSTTGMGHDITNNGPRMEQLEKFIYFGDILMSGPAHVSYMDQTIKSCTDRYEAMVPIFYNSTGSSGSETMALTKMIIAGGYLPKELKAELKLNGLYPATLLYIWKASLPYKVSYDNELRHRVAYNSDGNSCDTRRIKVNQFYHKYDDTTHLRNMVNLAKSMIVAPPIALLEVWSNSGGKPVYFLKTTVLVHQDRYETIKLRVSTQDSYDLQGLPLTFRWKVLYGNQNTTITREGDSSYYNITIKYDNNLPRGRTSILLIANNGKFDSNPAVINIYRAYGAENMRPSLDGLEDKTILPGEKVQLHIKSVDPERFPVHLYQWDGEVGSLEGNTFIWQCPVNHADSIEPVTIIASDGTSGNSYNSKQIKIHVSSTVAVISADTVQGKAPLVVKFSSSGSRDKKDGSLSYFWDFDDSVTSQEQNPVHTFKKPGFYEVTLQVKGPSGTHSSKLVIHARHNWPLVLKNGCRPNNWHGITADGPVDTEASFLRIYRKGEKESVKLTSVKDFIPPLYMEAVYYRPAEGSKKGTGFQILGTQIGYPANKVASARKISIGLPSEDDQSACVNQTILNNLSSPLHPTRLKLFVDNDPSHEGKFRFTGYLENETGTGFFKFDDQEIRDNKLVLLSASVNGRFEIRHLQVWSPER
ncbi:MAG: PKD domain-containing protein [Actinomycetia bacterium]|nr:PKD domain-containing protein [Actinomycetes bacterium]